MRLVYPSDDFNHKQPDEVYREEYLAAQAAGLSCSLYSVEEFESGQLTLRPAPLQDEEIVYRGWMLTPAAYTELCRLIQAQGGQPITSTDQYRACHYLPEWYPLCKAFTPETLFCDKTSDFYSILSGCDWGKYFVKDYVKSLTTQRGSVAETIAEIPEIIQMLEKFKGQVEGGICIRRFENLLAETEERYFVFKGQIFSRNGDVPNIVAAISTRIHSPFYAIDMIANTEGELRLIEIGDGQVSDYKKWQPDQFVKIFK